MEDHRDTIVQIVDCEPMPKTQQIFLIKFIHSLVVLFMTFCVAYVWYSAIIGTRSPWLWFFTGILLLEGMIWWFNGRRCPLTTWAIHLGDETGNDLFGDYLLPNWMAARYLPICATLLILGFVAMGVLSVTA